MCSLELETNQAGQVDQLQVAGQTYRTIINTTLGKTLFKKADDFALKVIFIDNHKHKHTGWFDVI